MEIQVNQADIEKVKAMTADIKNGYKIVLVTAINATLSTTKTQAKARLRNELNLKASRIEQDFKVNKANFAKISGSLVAQGKPVGLINFAANQTEKGVSVKIFRQDKRVFLKHAYISKGRGELGTKEHVFWRKNRPEGLRSKFPAGKRSKAPWVRFGEKYRLPTKRLNGPRIEDIFAKPKVLDPITIQANFLFLSNVEKKITDVLRRHNG